MQLDERLITSSEIYVKGMDSSLVPSPVYDKHLLDLSQVCDLGRGCRIQEHTYSLLSKVYLISVTSVPITHHPTRWF